MGFVIWKAVVAMLKKHCAYVCPDVKKYFCGEHQSAFS